MKFTPITVGKRMCHVVLTVFLNLNHYLESSIKQSYRFKLKYGDIYQRGHP
jgi:hypothetical protein